MNRKKVVANIFFSLVILAIFGWVMGHEINASDFPEHIGWAREYGEVGYLNQIPHTLFAKLVIIIRALLPANILVRVSPLAKQVYGLKSYEISTWILMGISYLATAYILYKRIIHEWKLEQQTRIPWLPYAVVLQILLVGPIFLFTFPERLYLGYFNPNPYHNPTYVLFRPFVLLLFFGVVDNLFARWNRRESLIACVALFCATLAKPSFTITILPAIGLVVVLFYIRQWKNLNWLYLFFPLGLTALVVLLSQFFINYSGYWGDTIIFAPFAALLTYVPNIPSILAFTLLSILFPLLMAVFYRKHTAGSLSFRLAWMNFMISLALGYFVGEKINLTSNNFAWGVMIAVFLLFTDAIIRFAGILHKDGLKASLAKWKNWVVGGILIVHLACGIIYYVFCIIKTTLLVK